jgi:hypothetical protein
LSNRYDLAEQAYYEWLTDMLPGWRSGHSRLLRQLFETPFQYAVGTDANRIDDGMELRSRFCWERGYSANVRHELKNRRECSVLEIMISMALRCEEEFMTLYTEDERTERWVGWMIRSMDLDRFTDGQYDPDAVHAALQSMMIRDYSPDGRGSLFYIPGYRGDMRQIDLWEQMMCWIEFVNENEGGI